MARKSTERKLERRELEEAFRRRAGVIGALQSCLCTYPFVNAEASRSTGHAPWCPAHAMLEFLQARERADLTRGLHADESMCRICGCVDEDCANCWRRTGEACTWIEKDLCSACFRIAVQLAAAAAGSGAA